MEINSISLLKLGSSVRAHRNLLFNLARRETLGKYKESLFGSLWSILSPLLMLVIFTFVFTNIFKSRWGVAIDTGPISYSVILFAGLIIFNLFSECFGKAPTIIISNQNFVKKIVFPLEILPIVSLLSALFQACISFAILLVYIFIEAGSVSWTALLLPVGLLPYIIFLLGFMYWLSATGVFVRDIGQTIGIFTTGMMFISPIFFPASSFPENWQFLAYYNPLTYPIEQTRDLLVFGNGIDWPVWILYLGYSTVFCALGYAWFQKLRTGFADVL
ncbi:ABC transporter permease [Pseudomonas sp. 5P_3.1_Bac2]|uniref:ABC transporter permease n=1 Tax=Pseudomonas sp. 5P_3.1_Bac2 TaxID=2971617 RepID=UPI0021C7888E|nr:ABC transporter permease [Pseudomonas sp. 5P_3.1_Bac2]MCU1719136.1 ABC transporter permease [Pseudomonas sp. 5P_3.1_Bac2]